MSAGPPRRRGSRWSAAVGPPVARPLPLLLLLLLPVSPPPGAQHQNHLLAAASRPSRVDRRADRLTAALQAADTLDAGGGSCIEEVTLVVDEDGLWYGRLGDDATDEITHGDTFSLKEDSCNGPRLDANLDVSPRINATDPIDGSYSHIGIRILTTGARWPDNFYLCLTSRAVQRPCLALLHAPSMGTLLRYFTGFLRLSRSLVRHSELVKALGGVSMIIFATLEALFFLVVASFFVTLFRALLAFAFLKKQKAIHDLGAMKTQKPSVILLTAGFKILSFVAAIQNLFGVSLPKMMKTVHPGLLTAIYLWPCTFGIFFVVRFSYLICSIQRYEAGLFHGKIILVNKSAQRSTAVAIAGLCFLFVCYLAGMAYVWSAEAFAAMMLAASPTLSIIKVMVAMRSLARVQSKREIKMCLSELMELDGTGSEAKKTGEDPNVLTVISGCRNQEISEGAFCSICRANGDPLPLLDENSQGPFPEGKGFRMNDFEWHARYIYRVTGSRVAFLNLPVMLLFVAMLLLLSMQALLNCTTNLPRLDRADVGNSILEPKFESEQRFYSLYYDNGIQNLEILHSMHESTTQQVSISISAGAYQNSSIAGDLTAVELRDVRAPWEIQILARGTWGRVRDYTLQLFPVSTLVRSITLSAKGSWHRCVEWGSIKKQHMVAVPRLENNFDIDLDVEDFPFSNPQPLHVLGQRIYMDFVPFRRGTEDCTELCEHAPLCRIAWEGSHGCFFGMKPKGTSSCEIQNSSINAGDGSAAPVAAKGRYLQYLHQRAKRCSVQLCLRLGKATKEVCTMVQGNEHGHVRLTNISFPREGTTKARLDVLRLTTSGRQAKIDSRSFLLVRGAPRIQDALVYARGVKMTVRVVQAQRASQILLDILDMDLPKLPDPFPITIAPFIEDNEYHMGIEEEEAGVGIENPDKSYREARLENSSYRLPKGCAWRPSWNALSVCGGPLDTGAITFMVPKWNPTGSDMGFQLWPTVDKLERRNVSVVVDMEGIYTPAEMAINKDCAVAFGKPAAFVREFITPDIFLVGLEKCRGRNITLDAAVVNTFSLERFFLLGVRMYPAMVGRYMNTVVEQEAFVLGLEEYLTKKWLVTPTKVGIDLRIPMRSIAREIDVWAPWLSRSKAEISLSVETLVQQGLILVAKLVCQHSSLTARSAYRALNAMTATYSSTTGVLARCFRGKKLKFDIPMASQSPEVAALRERRYDKLEALRAYKLLGLRIGDVAKRGPSISYVERDLTSFQFVYGCPISACGSFLRTLNLTGMGLAVGDLSRASSRLREYRQRKEADIPLNIETLDLSWNQLDLNAVCELFQTMSEYPKFRDRLRRLRLGHSVGSLVGDVSCLQGLPALEELDLSAANLGLSGATFLIDVLSGAPRLETLNLASNKLGNQGMRLLAQSLGRLTRLRSLDISGNDIDADGLRALNKTALSTLEVLHLSENRMGEDNCTALAAVLANTTRLRTLGLGGNGIGVGAAATLGAARASEVLQTLDLSRNPLTEPGLVALHLERRTGLLTLDLRDTSLGADGAVALAEAMPKIPHLQSLQLDSNAIGAVGVLALTPALAGANKLTALSLGDNDIGASEKGPAVLTQALKGLTPQLKHLDLGQNGFHTVDVAAMCDVFRDLETLRLQDNKFSQHGQRLWQCLAGLAKVRTLDVSGSSIFAVDKYSLQKDIELAIQGMISLETLHIQGNTVLVDVISEIIDFLEQLKDKGETALKFIHLRGAVTVPGDVITGQDLTMLQSAFIWLMLA